ncbi:putative P-loop containing nucleoside triphosphate hydrolase, leucine-rich repeat domain, L [Rosa chinensis]|uniref:Putative P-loop containing nucleoside triphosphate hydrolase, leucine-rich repeat domain, L n=1 Tax=Rosa chinensis TaxID=74649 RepID=A0A2P6RYP2_ROSCH|nr:putative P-loop containing nucleoside triphosphate hydrolase, leucine-rich repeat domain, L [Rosa chinensis]
MHLQLLHAFMEDVHGLEVLESEMENTWVMEANDTISQAKDVIDTINATENKNKRGWISEPNNWIRRWKHREDIVSVGTRISGLLTTKERFGVNFIKFIESSKSAHHSPKHQAFQHPTEPDIGLSDAVNNIRNLLDQLPKTSTKLVAQVSKVNEELDKLLEHTKETEEYAVNLRNASWKLLKKTASEANEQYQKTASKFLSKTILVRIKNAVNVLERCLKVYSIDAREESCSVFGLDEDIHELVSRLTTNSEPASSIIPIVGMKGIGKTTLAKHVYYHANIVKHFPVRRWVSLPPYQNSDEFAFLRSVGIQVRETKEKYSNAYESKAYWINRVRNFLNMKMFLLVLDNVVSMEVWDSLKQALPERTKGSKIVLITRNKAIALNADRDSIPHQLRLRTQEESWELFSQIVLVQYNDPEKKETNRVKEVVGSSFGGLPLDIIASGSLLWGKQITAEEILRVLGRSTTQGQDQNPWSLNKAVNEDDLQENQSFRHCLSYFQLFPPDFEIPVRRIVAWWVARELEGINENHIPENWVTQRLRQVNEIRIPETLANEYLQELIGRNMIQVVKKKPDGKAKTCRLPSSMGALLLQGQGVNSSETDPSESSPDQDNGPTGTNTQQNESEHKSIIFFETVERNKPNQEICDFLRKGIADGFLGQLQFLDLERVFQPLLPNAIGNLKRLVYLGLRWTYLESIPKSIGKLVELQTLDLKHTYIQHNLPSSIWKLKKLRYLYLNHNCQLPQLTRLILLPRSNTIGMKDLQKLSGVFVDNVNLVKDGLGKLINLRKLELAFQLDTSDEQDVVESWIAKLKFLESLKLKSIDKKRKLRDLKLQFLPTLELLSRLHLFGKLVNRQIINQVPQSLTHLTLSASEIEDDPMPVLGTLQNLISLSFYSGSYLGRRMVCRMNGFPKLVVLKLCKLAALEILDLQEAMPKLSNLVIKYSKKPKVTVVGLTRLTTVQEFEQSAAAEE